ncbi:MAG: heavy metal-associated domain-containing protein [Bacteroidota bacterium]
MKALRYLVLFALIATVAPNAKAQFEKAEVWVSGMTCSMCQMATQKSLKTIDYIGSIEPNLKTNSFILTFKKGKEVDLDVIKKKIKDAGFSVSRLITTFNFNNRTSVTNNFVFTYAGSTYRFVNVGDKVLHGEVNLLLLSSGFVSTSDYKRYSAQNFDPSYKTGMSGKARILHVTLASN